MPGILAVFSGITEDYTAAEEMKALGAGELFDAMDECAQHRNVEFPGHSHASFYNVNAIEPYVRDLVISMGIELLLETHAEDVICKNNTVLSVVLSDENKGSICASGYAGRHDIHISLLHGSECAGHPEVREAGTPRISLCGICKRF